jgi:hypothetical protein
MEFHFLIIGGGSAGGVLAACLSASGKHEFAGTAGTFVNFLTALKAGGNRQMHAVRAIVSIAWRDALDGVLAAMNLTTQY